MTWLVLAGIAVAPALGETLTYVLTPKPDKGVMQVELAWQTEGRTTSVLCAAEHWGSVSDVAAMIKQVTFAGAVLQGKDKACWTVSHRLGAAVGCRYVVDPGRREFDWPAMHLPVTTTSFFHGVGSTFLLAPKAGEAGAPQEYEVLVRWNTPKDWKAVCSWGSGRALGMRLKVDDLRQSVYLAGPLVTRTVKVPGANELTVAMLDRFGFETTSFVKLATDIIAEECKFMEEKEFPPFVVTAIPVGEPAKSGQMSLSGTGLYQSFALFVPPGAKLTEGVEHVFAHELFHYWNGRILGREEPEELVYWFTEGFTDYYTLRTLFEAGRWNAETYAKWVNRVLRAYHANPARNATNDRIRADFWRERDTVGEVAYQRGTLLALRWHRLARDHGVRDGLDRLFKSLVERGRTGFKVSNEAIRAEGVKLLGDWLGPDFDRYVTRAETVEVPENALTPELVGAVTTVYEFDLGFERRKSLDEKRAAGLVPGSEAEKAGLREGDELTGWSIYGEADQEVMLKVRRNGEVQTIRYYPRGKASEILQFKPAEKKPGG